MNLTSIVMLVSALIVGVIGLLYIRIARRLDRQYAASSLGDRDNIESVLGNWVMGIVCLLVALVLLYSSYKA